MPTGTPSSTAVATIAEMTTPALLILGSASLVASALVRMARVVDRARMLATIAYAGDWTKAGASPLELRASLAHHAARARYAEQSIGLLYTAIVMFVLTCLSIVVDRATDHALGWTPVILAVIGTGLLLAGGTWMVVECRLSGEQIAGEIRDALARLEGTRS